MSQGYLYNGNRKNTLDAYDYGARTYMPFFGAFLQGDDLVPDPLNPQATNRYSYVLNNPINLIDPTGHRPAPGSTFSGPSPLGLYVPPYHEPRSQPMLFGSGVAMAKGRFGYSPDGGFSSDYGHRFLFTMRDIYSRFDYYGMVTGHTWLVDSTFGPGLQVTTTATKLPVYGPDSGRIDLYIRSFANWESFGFLGFHGDALSRPPNGGFTIAGDATSRISTRIHLNATTLEVISNLDAPRAVSSESKWIFGTATGSPTLTLTEGDGELRIGISGSNPLLPSPPIDIVVSLANQGGVLTGSVFGDAFPNLEIFIVTPGGAGIMVHTFQTPFDRHTGVLELFSDGRRPMRR